MPRPGGRPRHAHCEGAGDEPVGVPVGDPASVPALGEVPEDVPGGVGWVEVVAPGWLPGSGPLVGWLDPVVSVPPALGVPPEEVDDEVPAGGAVALGVRALGATPPTLIAVEVPPVG